MKRWFVLAVTSIFLMGCEVMDDIAWSDETYLASSESNDGWLLERYETKTYGNFDGVNAGGRFDYYVTNQRSQVLCFKMHFTSFRADGYEYGYLHRIEPGMQTRVAFASTFNTSGWTLEVRSEYEWGWIESWEDCETDINWQ